MSMSAARVAWKAREHAEKEIGKSVISDENYLKAPEKTKRISNKHK